MTALTYFNSALAYLFKDEGSSYTDDPDDSGGPTKWGVTLKAYSQFMGRPVDPEEIRALTIEQVSPFYEDRYWEAMLCDKMRDAGTAIAIFDTGVLSGTSAAQVIAQQALVLCGAELTMDGIIGPTTVELLNQVPRAKFLSSFTSILLRRIDDIIARRPKDEKFRKGWINRAQRLLTLNSGTSFTIKAIV